MIAGTFTGPSIKAQSQSIKAAAVAGSHDLDACLLRGQRRLATLEAVHSDRGSTMEGLLPSRGRPFSVLACRQGFHSRLPLHPHDSTLRAALRRACNTLRNRLKG
jgi:hypothetical protein